VSCLSFFSIKMLVNFKTSRIGKRLTWRCVIHTPFLLHLLNFRKFYSVTCIIFIFLSKSLSSNFISNRTWSQWFCEYKTTYSLHICVFLYIERETIGKTVPINCDNNTNPTVLYIYIYNTINVRTIVRLEYSTWRLVFHFTLQFNCF
jgi:hypothetical protein